VHHDPKAASPRRGEARLLGLVLFGRQPRRLAFFIGSLSLLAILKLTRREQRSVPSLGGSPTRRTLFRVFQEDFRIARKCGAFCPNVARRRTTVKDGLEP
jgi:hypothetical protein